ncbi:hypothetical protein ANRL1_01751 [Anaerolineae bacterium]|nr:hypothetical protein ANRL1_01751 [Anaerolineae bacterium]
MDYGKILARSLTVTWKYRVLWLFGVLFAIFGGSRSGGNFNFPGGGSGSGMRDTGSLTPDFPPVNEQVILVIVAAAVVFVLIWILLSIIMRFISRGALIGLVHELETTETKPTVRRGFNLGFNHFKPLFGIGLIVNLPITLVMLGLIFVAAVPLLASLVPLAASGARRPAELWSLAAVGIASSIFLICCVALFAWLVQLIVKPFYEFFVRACVIGKRGAMDSLREGYRLVRANLGSVAILYVLTIGIGIGYALLMIPVFLILIGIPAGAGFATYLIAQSLTPALVVGGVIAIPMIALLLLIAGMYETFESTMWTEAYLAVTAPPKIADAPAAVTPTPLEPAQT